MRSQPAASPGQIASPRVSRAASRALLAAILGLGPLRLAAQFSYSEDFKNTTAPGWNFYSSGVGPGPRLTSGAAPTTGDPEWGNTFIDASGQGWLRLTSSSVNNQANAVYFDTPIPSAGNEVKISFDATMWGGNNYQNTGADGLVFFLYDASQAFAPGAYGGSLGYANGHNLPGLGGGFLGVAFDVFGNFSNPTEGRNGGPGFIPNAVVARGPGSGANGYNYLAGTSGTSGPAGRDYTASGSPIAADGADPIVPALPYVMGSPLATERPNQATKYRKVEIILDENSRVVVRMQFGEDGLWYDVLNLDVSSFVRPEQLRIGFSAGTGGGTMVYEVGGLLKIDATAGSGNFMWDNDEGTQVWGTSATNPLNWFGNTNPVLKSNIIFNSAYINSAQTIDLRGSDKVVKNIYLSGPHAYSLFTTEDRRLIFDSDTVNGLTTISLTNDVAGNAAHTVGVNLLLNKTLDINNNIAPLFTLAGGIDTNGNALNFKGTGTTLVTGVISGAGNLSKADVGTTRLSGANTYTGTTTVSGGTLEIAHANALGATSAGTTVQSGGTLALAGPGTTFAAESLTLSGVGAGGVGALRNREGDNTLPGTINLAAATRVSADAGTTLALNGVVSGAAASTFEKTGSGTIVLGAANTYAGATQIRGGVLAVSNENNLGANPGSFQAAHLLLDGGTLRSQTNAVVIDDANRGVTLGPGGGAFDTVTNLTIANVVTGSGALTKTGSATLTLSGANTHSGPVFIQAGALAATGGNALGDASAVSVSSGATLDITAANETIGSLAGAGQVALGARTLTLGGNNGSTTFSGVASGAGGGLVKTGSGTLTLSGANTYSGVTTVSAGTLQLGAANVLADASTLALAGGRLRVGGDFSDTIGSLSLSADSTIDFANATSTLTFTNASRSAGSLTIDNWAGEAFGGGNSRLVFTNAPTGFATGSNGEFTQIQFTDWGSGAIRLTSGPNAGEIVPYTGGTVYTYVPAGSGTWGTNGNWTPSGFAQNIGDTAILGASITSPSSIDLGGARTLGYLVVNNPHAYTLSNGTLAFDVHSGRAQLVNQGAGGLVFGGDISLNDHFTLTQAGSGAVTLSGNNLTGANRDILVTGDGSGLVTLGGAINTGSGSLTKNGSGTLRLTGANNFSGAVNVNGGVLAIRSANNLGTGAATLTLSGGTLRSEVNAVTLSSRPVAIGAAGGGFDTLTNLSIGTVVSGAGAITKTGSGTLTLSGANTHTGNIAVEGGALTVSGGSAVGNAAAVTLASGTTFNVNSTETIGSVGGAGAVVLGSGVTLTTGGTADTTLSGPVSGSGALTKQGSGSFTLSGNNSHTGATTINAGTLVAAHANALGATAAGTTVASGATLALSGGISIGNEALALNGDGVGTGGALRNLSGNNSYAGAITLGSASRIQSDAGTLTLGGGITGATFGLTFAGAGDTTVSGAIATTSGTLAKTGAGTLTLSGNNTYTGATTVSQGTLVASSNAALGSTDSGTTVASGATLALTGVNLGGEALTLNGQGVGSLGALRALSGANTHTGAVTLGGETWIGVANGASLSLSGVVSGGFGLTKLGDGTLTLSGANTHTGTTAVTAGTLVAASAGALGTTAAPTTISSGATLAFSGTFSSGEAITVGGSGVGGAGAIQGLSGTTTLTGTVTMNANSVVGVASGATLRLNGLLTEESGADYNLVKAGEGTLVLAANNAYNGATTLRAGTLRLEANAPVSANGALGNASSALQIGDAASGSSALTLELGNASGGLSLDRAVAVNNFGGAVTLAGANTSGTNSFNGSVTLSNKPVTLSAASGGTVAFNGVIGGSGDVTKTGAGTVLLAGNNSYAGATTVSAGTLVAAHGNALGATGAGNGTTIAGGATLGIQGGITLPAGEAVTLSGTGATGNGAIRNVSGNNTLAGPLTLAADSSIGSTADTLTISGAVGQSGGARSLTTTGAGAITFTGANTITGGLSVANGTTTLANNSGQAFGSVSSVTVNGATSVLALGAAHQINDAANLTLTNGGTLNVGSFSETLRTLTVTNSGRINFLDDGSALRFDGGGSVNGLVSPITGTLSIDNWAGRLTGGGSEQLIIRSTTNIAGTTINNLTFTGWGTGNNNTVVSLGNNLYEIVPLVSGTYWDVNGNGNWSGNNWDNGTNTTVSGPNAADSIAILGDRVTGNNQFTALTVDPTVSISDNGSGGDRTVGRLIFNNSANRNYTINDTANQTRFLRFDVSGGAAQIIVNDNGAHNINIGTVFNDAVVVTNNSQHANSPGLTFSLGMDLQGNAATFAGSGTTRVNGVVSGAGSSLLKTGSGTLILAGANTYDGGTTLRHGTIDLRNAGGLGSTGAITINDASTTASMNTALVLGVAGLDLTRPITVNNFGATTTLGGTHTSGTSTFSGAITLNKSVTLAAASGGTVAFTGAMSGTGGATVAGPGIVTFGGSAGSKSYTGPTTVSAGGTLRLTAANTAPLNSAVTIASGGAFDANGFTASIGSLAGAGSLALGSGSTTFSVGSLLNSNTTFSGVISGGANAVFEKTGSSTLTLAGANTHAGATNVTQGTLIAASHSALGTTAGATNVSAGATLGLTGGITITGETLNLTGGTSATTLQNIAGNNTVTGPVAMAGTVVRVGAASDSSLTLSGQVSGSSEFLKNDAGTVVLSGNNTYTGATTIAQGTLVAANNNALGTTAAGTTVFAGATLGLQNNITLAAGESITVNAALSPSAPSLSNLSGANTINGGTTLTGNVNAGAVVQVAAGSTLTHNGAITETGGAKFLAKTGEGQLTLGGGGANTFSGGLRIDQGVVLAQKTAGVDATGRGEVLVGDGIGAANTATLRLGASNQIWDSSDVTIRTDGRLDLQTHNETVRALTMTGGSVTGSGTLTLGGNLTFSGVGSATASISANVSLNNASRIVQVGNNGLNGDSDLTLSGVVSGAGHTLRKTDLGTLELTGSSANTFTGSTAGVQINGVAQNVVVGLQVDDGVVLLNKTEHVNAVGGGAVVIGDGLLGANSAVVRYGTNNQLANDTNIVFRSDGLLDMNGRTDTIGAINSGVAGAGHIVIGTGQLIVGSGGANSTYSGLLTGVREGVLEKTGAGTLTLSDADTLRADRVMSFGGEIRLAEGTLALDNLTLNVDTLRLTGSSTIDFGGASTLNVTRLIVELAEGQQTLITSWTEFVDFFYAGSFTATEGGQDIPFDTRGQPPQNRIVFANWTGDNTWWQSWDNQVTPVPEPSIYGAFAVGGLLGWFATRRRRRV
jgi:autotransporter-associated beta strand protein